GATTAYLFDPPAATRWVLSNRDGNLGQKRWEGQNPPDGAIISYYLKAAATTAPTITIADKSGKVVRTIRNAPRDAGVDRIVWNLRMDPPSGGGGGGRGGGAGGGGAGAPPGRESTAGVSQQG